MLRRSLLRAFTMVLCAAAALSQAGAVPVLADESAQAQRASKQMQAKRFEEALTSLTEAIADDNNDPMLYFRRAQCFYCLNRYKDAIEDFDHAIAFEPGVPSFFLWRGTAHAKLGEDQAAIRDYEKAMRLNPDLVSAYNEAHTGNKASSADTTGTPAPAIENGTVPSAKPSATAIVPTTATGTAPTTATGTVPKTAAGTVPTTAAATAPTTAAATVPSTTPNGTVPTTISTATVPSWAASTTVVSTAAHGTIASITVSGNTAQTEATPAKDSEIKKKTIDLGYSAGALQDYAEAVKRASVKSVAYFRAGTVFSGLCELDLNGKLIGTPWDCSADGTLSKRDAADYFTLKNATKDMRDADDQISQNPAVAKFYYARGRSYQQLGKTDLARADLTRAIDLDRTSVMYLLARSFLYHQLDKKDLAGVDLTAALDLDPSLPRFVSFAPPKFVSTEDKSPK